VWFQPTLVLLSCASDVPDDDQQPTACCVLVVRPFVADTVEYLNSAYESGKRILIEGANATMLDIDFGTYPYVTSSNPSVGGIATGLGLAPNKYDALIGVVSDHKPRHVPCVSMFHLPQCVLAEQALSSLVPCVDTEMSTRPLPTSRSRPTPHVLELVPIPQSCLGPWLMSCVRWVAGCEDGGIVWCIQCSPTSCPAAVGNHTCLL
jgi:hypothetical protein